MGELLDMVRALGLGDPNHVASAPPPPPPREPTMRARTTMEAIQDTLRLPYQWASESLPGMVTDALGISNFKGTAADTPADPHMMGIVTPNLPGAMGPTLDTVATKFPRLANAIKAYHGSPHDFAPEPGAPLGKFKSAAIGTGEGAQAYGHGLYFAENEGTAAAYKPLAPREFIGGSGAVDWDNPIHVAIRASDLAGGPAPGIARLQDTLTAKTASASNKAVAQKAIDFLKSGAPFDPHVKPAGKMYEVEIKADPAHFLDWDKPMVEQSDTVKAALKKAGLYEETTGSPTRPRPRTGMHLATALSMDDVSGFNQVAASQKLRQAGIPGIKYLDQGSRAGGAGTSNFVVFDEGLIDILKKYGVAGAAIDLLRRKAQQQGGTVSQADLDSL